MASTYTRGNSPFIYIRFKNLETGKWEAKPTEYRKDNIGDVRQANLLADEMSVEERASKPLSNREHWDEWVDRWMIDRYGAESSSYDQYGRRWKQLRRWLHASQINAPRQLSYPAILRYKEHRIKQGVIINTVIAELKFLGVIMGEAIHRRFAKENPCLKMGFKRVKPKPKKRWSLQQVTTVAAAIPQQSDFIQATFILGYYQAARLGQCEVPLDDINIPARRITYWRSLRGKALTKGDKPFTQPLTEAAIPMLTALMERRAAAGFRDLCEIPVIPSVRWREFLDSLGPEFEEISHHGLRATWITHAALSRQKISREEAKQFVNHGSTSVHEIYQLLNADDVAHVPDALALPDLSQVQKSPPPLTTPLQP